MIQKLSFLACRRGSTAIEFALVAPLLVTALLGSIEAYGLFQASNKTIAAAFTVADLTSQANSQTTASLGSIISAAQHVLDPLPNTLGPTFSVSIASVGFDSSSGKPVALWRYAAGGGEDVDITKAQGLGVSGESVLGVTVSYTYTPMITAYIGTTTFSETALLRPRRGVPILLNGKVQSP